MITRIEITKAYDHLQAVHKTDGRYLLDLPGENAIRTTESMANTFPGQVEVPAAYPLTLQGTDRNMSALDPFLRTSSSLLVGTGVDVAVYRGSEMLQFRKLFVKSIDDSSNTIAIELHLGIDFWTDLAANTPINTIPYAPIEFTKANVLDINNTKAQYADGDEGIYFPWVFYGKLLQPDTLTTPDLRPFVHIYALLKKGFAKIDHCFTSPMLATSYGRRLIAYLLRSDYGRGDQNNRLRNLQAVVSQDVTITNQQKLYNNTPFDDVVSDIGGNYSTITPPIMSDASYFWVGPGFVGLIEYEIKLWSPITSALRTLYELKEADITAELWAEVPGFDAPILLKHTDYNKQATLIENPAGGRPLRWEVTLSDSLNDAEIPPNTKLYVKLFYKYTFRHDMIVKKGSYLKITAARSIYSEGDTIDMYKELDPSISLLDVFKGVAHIMNGRIFYNFARKHIILFPPFDTIMHGETAEGFYKENGYVELSLTDIQPDSLRRMRDKDIEAYDLTLGFAMSSDPAITQDTKLKTDKGQLFDRTTRVGSGKFKGKLIEMRNSLFEPTVNKPVNIAQSIAPFNDPVYRAPLDMPYLTDNYNYATNDTVDKLSYNIRPRLLYTTGKDHFRVKMDDGTLVIPGAVFHYADTITAYAFNMPNMLQVSGQAIDRRAVYGDVHLKDWFWWFYEKDLRETYLNYPYEFLAYLGSHNYTQISFRNKLLINYLGTMYAGRLIEKRDYDGGITGVSTPIVIYPLRGNYTPEASYLEPLEPRDQCDTSELLIAIVNNNGTYEFAIDGNSSSTIDEVVFEWMYPDDAGWTVGDSVTDPTGVFIVKMTVVFDGDCPPFTLTKTVFPCTNTVVPILSYNEVSRCMTVDYDPAYISSDIDTVTIEYSYDGVTWEEYTGTVCDIPNDAVEMLITITITFNDGCTQAQGTASYNFPPPESDCSQITADISADETPSCLVLPKRTGDVIEDILVLDMIFFRYDEDDEWQLWDENTPLSQPVFLRRVITNVGCPPIEKLAQYPPAP